MYGARFEAGDPLPADVGEELAAIGLAVKVSPAPAGDEPGDDEKGAQ
jgi:hypothetical protein